MNMWRKHLAAQERSGKSISEYCRQRGIDPRRLYYWQRKGSRPAVRKTEFIEIKKPGRGNFELRIREGMILIIPERFEPEQLKRLLEALEC